jgi:hypothetical protein
MKPPKFELADVIARFGADYVTRYSPNIYIQQVLSDILHCRTSHLGKHTQKCNRCNTEHTSYNSCRNRHCPKCQATKQALWVDELIKTTLPVKHFHIVFTVPHELNAICLQNSAEYYKMLFSSVWETLRSFGYTHYGIESGAVCVLHTWGQNLSLHPHIHCIVPAAGISLAGYQKYITKGGKYLYPVTQLSASFKALFLRKVKAYVKINNYRFNTVLQSAWDKKWVVHCEPSLAKAEHVIKYLGQYTHRVAITNHRILSITDTTVTFLYKDYADKSKQKPIPLTGVEFLRRFVQHILPKRFVKIRRYGVYSSRSRALRKVETLKMEVSTKPPITRQERIAELIGFDVLKCRKCKIGIMETIEQTAHQRAPPLQYSLSKCK